MPGRVSMKLGSVIPWSLTFDQVRLQRHKNNLLQIGRRKEIGHIAHHLAVSERKSSSHLVALRIAEVELHGCALFI